MDREFLFRGKRADDGKWIEGFLTISKDEYHIIDLNDEYITALVILDTIGEYTNFKDKNGTKIYEGDIVDFTVDQRFYKGVVKWSDTEHIQTGFTIWHDNENEYYDADGAFDLGWVHYQDSEFEVIGNVYDNPELLGKGE